MLDDLLKIGSTIFDRIFPNKADADQAKLKLLELQQTGQLKEIEAELQQSRIEADDRSSARQLEIEKVRNNPNQKYTITTVLASAFTIGFFAVAILLLFIFRSPQEYFDERELTLIGAIVGYLASSLNQIISFYFGSSSGSKTKDRLLENVLRDINPEN